MLTTKKKNKVLFLWKTITEVGVRRHYQVHMLDLSIILIIFFMDLRNNLYQKKKANKSTYYQVVQLMKQWKVC